MTASAQPPRRLLAAVSLAALLLLTSGCQTAGGRLAGNTYRHPGGWFTWQVMPKQFRRTKVRIEEHTAPGLFSVVAFPQPSVGDVYRLEVLRASDAEPPIPMPSQADQAVLEALLAHLWDTYLNSEVEGARILESSFHPEVEHGAMLALAYYPGVDTGWQRYDPELGAGVPSLKEHLRAMLLIYRPPYIAVAHYGRDWQSYGREEGPLETRNYWPSTRKLLLDAALSMADRITFYDIPAQ